MRLVFVVTLTLLGCVRVAPRPLGSPPTAAGLVADAGVVVANVDAGTVVADAGALVVTTAGPLGDGGVPPAARFTSCHDATAADREAEQLRHDLALDAALSARGLARLATHRSFEFGAPGQVVRNQSGQHQMVVLSVESCGPVSPPLVAIDRAGVVTFIDASPAPKTRTTVPRCTPPTQQCPPSCGQRPAPTTFVAVVPPGATLRFPARAVKYPIDELLVFPPAETWRNDCPPAP